MESLAFNPSFQLVGAERSWFHFRDASIPGAGKWRGLFIKMFAVQTTDNKRDVIMIFAWHVACKQNRFTCKAEPNPKAFLI